MFRMARSMSSETDTHPASVIRAASGAASEAVSLSSHSSFFLSVFLSFVLSFDSLEVETNDSSFAGRTGGVIPSLSSLRGRGGGGRGRQS